MARQHLANRITNSLHIGVGHGWKQWQRHRFLGNPFSIRQFPVMVAIPAEQGGQMRCLVGDASTNAACFQGRAKLLAVNRQPVQRQQWRE